MSNTSSDPSPADKPQPNVEQSTTDSEIKLPDQQHNETGSNMMKVNPHSINDWRQAVRNPPAYRIGNNTVRLQTKFVYVVAFAGALILIYIFFFGGRSTDNQSSNNGLLLGDDDHGHLHRYSGLDKDVAGRPAVPYNRTYPLTPPVTTARGVTFKLYVITDLDVDSRLKDESDTWVSHLKRGLLTYNPRDNDVSVEWTDEPLITLKSTISCGGRGMELSELVVFNGKLYTVDDRTGIVYHLDTRPAPSATGSASPTIRIKTIPWVILPDGDGTESKGFKSEWATVKNEQLYVGGLGKEWTSATGELIHLNPQWVKVISTTGGVEHVDWHSNYEKIKAKVNIKSPGYIIHEAVCWSEVHKKWVFLPRRASKEHYDEHTDEEMGTNLLIMADETFSDISVTRIGQVLPTHGFSTFKFVPGTDDRVIVAVKSEESKGKVASYIMAFDIAGSILLPEKKIGDFKFEGVEFA